MSNNEEKKTFLSILVGFFAIIGVIFLFANFASDKGIGPGPADTVLQWIAIIVIVSIIAALIKINQK